MSTAGGKSMANSKAERAQRAVGKKNVQRRLAAAIRPTRSSSWKGHSQDMTRDVYEDSSR